MRVEAPAAPAVTAAASALLRVRAVEAYSLGWAEQGQHLPLTTLLLLQQQQGLPRAAAQP